MRDSSSFPKHICTRLLGLPRLAGSCHACLTMTLTSRTRFEHAFDKVLDASTGHPHP
jgi:hypothetical protein